MDFPIAKRSWKSMAAALAAAAIIILVGGALSGCGGDEAKPLDTKDLPQDMKVSEDNRITQPTGNQFVNPNETKGRR